MSKKIDDNEILRLYHQGLLNREIADILGCATCTITSHLNKMGIKKYKNQKDLIERLHLEGLDDDEIAQQVGCCRSNVTIHLNHMGYTNRRGKIDNIPLRNRISQSLIGRYVGSANPNFKGYRDEKRVARGICKTFAKQIIRERGNVCEHCGEQGGKIQTHHIKPFKMILDEFLSTAYDGDISTIYDQLMNYPDFINKDNLVVLCRDCHLKVHYSDDPDLSPYRWERATTIENAS